MTYLILGENAYKAEQELRRIIGSGDVAPERIDSSTLTQNTLADIVRGGSLFSEKRLVILRQLSENKSLFDKLVEWAGEVSPDTTLVLRETKLDKRTKAYKAIVKIAKVIKADPLTERDTGIAEEWLRKVAKERDVKLSPAQVRDMVQRAMVASEKATTRNVDQMQLAHAIAALAVLHDVSDESIATVLPPATSDSVFDLLEMATNRQGERVETLFADLARSEDPHRVMALIMGQWAQLVSVALADGPSATIAVELGMHPFVAKKMQQLAAQFSKQQLRDLTALAADLDAGAKLSQFAPWDGVFRFVYALAKR